MTFKIHPAIGIARVGNSPDSFYIAPEEAAQLPIDCDKDGNTSTDANGQEKPITHFKDDQQRVRRQAARFRVYSYDENDAVGKEVEIGQNVSMVDPKSGQLIVGEVMDIEWTVHLANKKAAWYEFQETDGEHGYSPTHPLRNANITDGNARLQLIIDPGPLTVSYKDKKQRTAQFAKGMNPNYPQSFPPPLNPASIETLGELKVTQQDKHNRLLVLGGYGNSGSMLDGFGQPVITNYANNDGWFDDISDGPVLARIKYKIVSQDGRPPDPVKHPPMYATVETGAWVIVGYPRFVPQMLDIITMDELIYDLAVREFGYNTYLYGIPPFNGTEAPPAPDDANALALWREQAQWNTDYYPYFYRDIWPLLQRPNNFQFVMDFDALTGGDPHDTTPGLHLNFDPEILSVPPYEGEDPQLKADRLTWRMRIWGVLRKQGQENQWQLTPDSANPLPPNATKPHHMPVGMPFLCGDNPLSNTAASKFLRLTDTQLFILKQWAEGKFINEQNEDIPITDPEASAKTGTDLDRGVLSNLLGGSFCPGGEASWIMRNPAIYAEPYRINLNDQFKLTALTATSPQQPLAPVQNALSLTGDLSTGLEPGDITKYSGLPWQSDFNECATQPINITYEDWNKLYPKTTGDPALTPAHQIVQLTYWWPAHRPMTVSGTPWTDFPVNNQGDLMMVTLWNEQSFVLFKGYDNNPPFVMVEPDK